MSQDRSLDIKFACSYTISLSLMHLQMCTYYYSNPLHSYRNSMQRVEYLSDLFLHQLQPLSILSTIFLGGVGSHPNFVSVAPSLPPAVPAALKTIDVEVPVWPWHVSQDQRWGDHSRDPNLDPNKMGPPNYYEVDLSLVIPFLQPWLNRVCWGYNYITTRGAPSWTTPKSKFPIGVTPTSHDDFPTLLHHGFPWELFAIY